MQIRGYQIGVQSWCFRTYKTTEDVISAVKACGLDALELCGIHVDVENTVAVDNALRLYRAAGVTLNSFGVNGFGRDDARNRPVFELAKKAGIKAISADLDLNALGRVEDLCDEYGIKLAIHNHGRKHRLGSLDALRCLFDKASHQIGLCLDTAWMLDSGENPLAVVEMFSDRLYGLHVKDFTFRRDGSVEDVVVGTGNLDLPGLFNTLQKVGFSGYISLEYEGNVDNPIPSVQQCVAELKKL